MPSWVLTGLTVVIGIAVMVLGGSAPVNPVLVLVAVIGGAALFTALALITSAVTRNAEAARITCMPILILATAGMSSIRNVVPDKRCSHSRFHSAGRSSGPSQSRMAGADHWRTG